jgi:DNA repair protein RadD
LILPTGSGKSVILAEVARQVCEKGLDRRVLILAHRKELIEQNYEKFVSRRPFGSVGIFSAGLNRRETDSQVIFAGIQSAFRRADDLGAFSLVIIDECHLIPKSGDGMYRTLIDGLVRNNPAVRFAGLTATPYRLDSGLLTQGEGLFTGIAYEANIRDLIAQGYLSPLVSKCGKSKANLSLVRVRNGEYVAEEMERVFNRLDLVEASVNEIIAYGHDRKSWLIFGAGVSHAETIGTVLNKVGIPTGVVTGNTPPLFRDRIIREYKNGELRALVNCDVLTTGFDHPRVDLIAVLRATQSTALWVQICGRGARRADGKEDCIVLDFGENALRHGPIDRIRITYRRCPLTGNDESRVEAPLVKSCPTCRSVVMLSAKECPDCGTPFLETPRLNHQAQPSDAPILSTQEEPTYDVDVFKSDYCKHQKKDKPLPTMRADYYFSMIDGVPIGKVSEWICFEHDGFAGNKARRWWYARGGSLLESTPATVDEALARLTEIRNPKRLRIQREGKFWRIVKVLELFPEGEGGVGQEDEDFFNETGFNV